MSDIDRYSSIPSEKQQKNLWERELDLIWSVPNNFVNGVTERTQELIKNPMSAAPEIATAAAMAGLATYLLKRPAALCGFLKSTKILAPLDKNPEALMAGISKYAPKIGLGLLGLDVTNRVAQPMIDTAFNPQHHDYDKKWLGKNLGSMMIDYPLMGAAGIGGAATVELGPGAISGIRAMAKSFKSFRTTLDEPIQMAPGNDGAGMKTVLQTKETGIDRQQSLMRNLSEDEAHAVIRRFYTKAPQSAVDEARQLSKMKPEQMADHIKAQDYPGDKGLLQRVHQNRTISDPEILSIAEKHRILPDEVVQLMDIAMKDRELFNEIRAVCTTGVDEIIYGQGVEHQTAAAMKELLNDVEKASNMRFDASPPGLPFKPQQKVEATSADPELRTWVEDNSDYLTSVFRQPLEGELSRPEIIRYPSHTEVVMPGHSRIERVIHRPDGSIDVKAKNGLNARVDSDVKDRVILYTPEGNYAGFEWIPEPTTGRLRSLLTDNQIQKSANEHGLSESFYKRAATASFDEIVKMAQQINKLHASRIPGLGFSLDTAFEEILQMRTIRQFGFGENKTSAPWKRYYQNLKTQD